MPISYRAAQNLIKRADEAGLRTALASGLDANAVNQNGWSLLMLTALEGAVPLGQLLLENGAAIDARNRADETALSLAAQKGHVPFLEFLLQHGAPVSNQPHGTSLADWLRTSSGLSEPKLSEILQLLSLA